MEFYKIYILIMLRVCSYSKTSVHLGTIKYDESTCYLTIKTNNLRESDLKAVFDSVENILKPFDAGEYLGLNCTSFFEELSDVDNDHYLGSYIENFDDYDEIQFYESFSPEEERDDEYDDDKDDDDDYEEKDYSDLEDVDNLENISYDSINDYKVRFVKKGDNSIYIEISNDINLFTLSKKDFLSLYEG